MTERSVADMSDDEIEAVLAILERDEGAYMRAINEVAADDSIAVDDKQIAVCERIGHGEYLIAPVIHHDEMGTTWCDFCAVAVLLPGKHVLWHRRLQAAVKLAGHVAEMARKRAVLLGWVVARLTAEDSDDGT